ncbi:MAG: hypothetical protein CEN92_241 [Candidatus Berkelbacteria bacterium Licking1014_96]|uniref:Prepilin-type N-terminal cleavage/methylation domain-containing protein n=1 Tax=Candidatus Berkelbacteria bacterium Licking1014_96 TaxID=2017149 RepID=A0A554LF80_9BACT|nr:MAG: hypothetical protein CEN92_241 [Candidatus Berkelbacteria bacterium Licking1014_96]
MKNKNKIRGFTLLEVMISAAILIIVTGAAAASAVMAINSGTFSRNRTVAENLARGEIEKIMVIRDSSGWEGSDPLRAPRDDERTIDNQTFKIHSEVLEVGDDFIGETDYVDEKANMRRVTTTVSWEEGFWGGGKKVKIVTYLTNHQ